MSFITSLGDWLRKITRSFASASISGQNITLTRHNGDTVVLTTQDTVNNAFTKIKLGTVTLEPDAVDDTLTLGVGAGIQLSANATNDSITVSGVTATQSVAGIMSTTDKTKLDGIATGAEVNQNAFSNVKVGSTTVAADTKTDTLELVAGSNVTLTPDATNDKVTISATDVNVTATKVATFPSSTTNYYLLASSSDATATEGVSKFGTNARLQIKAGTTSTEGFATIILGNSTAAGTAGNVTGTLLLYNNSTKYAQLKAHNNDTINHTIYLPKAGGTLVCHTTDTAIGSATKPVYVSANGVATECTYELKKTVPADAVFTDHIYTAASDTPQPVTAVGAVGTSDKYAREDHIHSRRCAHVGQSGSSTTNPWFKFATFTINANWIGNETTFMVTGPYLDRYGILVVRFLSNGSAVFSSATVKWLVTHRIYPENFMLVVGNDNKTLELWAKCGSGYERYTFTVLSETSRGGPQSLWTLLTSVSAGEAASPTAGTQVLSTLEGAAGKLGTANVGSANQPIYLNAGVATACTVEGIVAQSIDTNNTSGHSSYIKFASGLVFIWGSESFSNTYIDITKKIACSTLLAFALDGEASSATGMTSNLHQFSWARANSTNTTERFVTNTSTVGFFTYFIIGKV